MTKARTADIFTEWQTEGGSSADFEALALSRLRLARQTLRAARHFIVWEYGKPDMDRLLSLTSAELTLGGLMQLIHEADIDD